MAPRRNVTPSARSSRVLLPLKLGIFELWTPPKELGLPPPAQDASRHQDYNIFSRGSRTKPSFATVPGRGDSPMDDPSIDFLGMDMSGLQHSGALLSIIGMSW